MDVVSDVSLALSLFHAEQDVLAWVVIGTLALPSIFMAVAPYQSMMERLATLMQLRIVWEVVSSAGNEYFSVR